MKPKIFIFFLVFVFLSGCASGPQYSRKYRDGKAGNLAVISLLGDQAEVRSFGITIFGSDYKIAKVPDWNVDADLISRTVARLKAEGDTVIDLKYDAKALMKSYRVNSYKKRLINIDPDHGVNRAYFVDAAKKYGIDRFIVVYRSAESGIIRIHTQHPPSAISGFGICKINGFEGEHIYALASVEVQVVDGKTGDIVERQRGSGYTGIDMKYWAPAYEKGSAERVRINPGDNEAFRHAVHLSVKKAALSVMHDLGFM